MLRRVFVLESCVDIADEMIVVVVANHHFFNLPVFTHFAPEVLVERIKVVLQLGRIHLVLLIIRRVLIKVREENSLAVGGFDMLS